MERGQISRMLCCGTAEEPEVEEETPVVKAIKARATPSQEGPCGWRLSFPSGPQRRGFRGQVHTGGWL